jgi:hypothetical protein
MKTGRMFWGVFFVTLGAAVLLQRFAVLSIQWHHAWIYWPLVLIAWGAALLFGSAIVKRIAVIIAAIILALILVGLFSLGWWDEVGGDGAITKDQTFEEPVVPGAMTAKFELDSGAGTFTIGDTTSEMVEVHTTTSLGAYTMDRQGGDDDAGYSLQLENAHTGWWPGRVTNRADVRLNAAPVWDIAMNVGAAKLRCDLSSYKVANLDLDCGAASVVLRLGKGVKASIVNINAGASSLNIEVPSETGCELNIEAPLSSKSVAGFMHLSKGHYQSENFDSAAEHCTINVDAGVSSIRVDRY